MDKEAFERIKAFAPGGITASFGPDPDHERQNIADLASVSPVPPRLTRNHIFLDWLRLGGDIMKAMQRTWHDIPMLLGNAKWNRNNLVDPFCGPEDARY